jgi:agmatinase
MVELVGLCYEGGDHLVAGASMAPQALRWGLETAEDYSVLFQTAIPKIKDHGDILLRHSSPEKAVKYVKNLLEEKLDPSHPFLILGGDHTVSYFVLEYLFQRGVSPMVLHLDAHLDRRDEYRGFRLGHATVMHRARELLGPGRIFSFGVRSRAEEEIVEENFFFPYEVRDPIEKILREHPKERFYLSLDLDVLDPSAFPAVGYPEPAGISLKELFLTFQLLRGRIIAADLVEYIPVRDPGGIFAQVGGVILKELLTVLSLLP